MNEFELSSDFPMFQISINRPGTTLTISAKNKEEFIKLVAEFANDVDGDILVEKLETIENKFVPKPVNVTTSDTLPSVEYPKCQGGHKRTRYQFYFKKEELIRDLISLNPTLKHEEFTDRNNVKRDKLVCTVCKAGCLICQVQKEGKNKGKWMATEIVGK